ncbi:Hypothetical predicted protein [Mytilus galloprovincialis]|uniref:Uncharacterized protein n=1 Tax=Mytilus galloprovincialis TaxID=29158 RepID=A0A8B6FK50_MYTGA|nr:Hypothetical predicted protein [Mytilus galloprovincialis]
MSYEDKMFMKQMDNEFVKRLGRKLGSTVTVPSAKTAIAKQQTTALHRASMLDASLNRNPVKREHFLTFMSKILDNNHAELAPPLGEHEECWYLPLFGVYHPKKPDQIRGVFDFFRQM